MAVGAILSGVASAMNIAGGVVNALGATSGSQMLGGVQQATGAASSMLGDTNKELTDANKQRLEWAKLEMREKQNQTRQYKAETQRMFVEQMGTNAGMQFETPNPTAMMNTLMQGHIDEQKMSPLFGGVK